MVKILGLSLLIWVSVVSSSYATPAEVILIRHGEKPLRGNGLNTRGWLRAHALVPFFTSNPAVTRFGTPVAIYAMGQLKPHSSIRAIQTLTPLAEYLGQTPHTEFTRDQYVGAAHEILNNPEYDGKMVLICWEHSVTPPFAAELGMKNGPDKWDPSVFDRAWILDYSNGEVTHFTDLPQHILPGDTAE